MRKEKQFLLDDFEEKLQGAKAIIVAKYSSIEPNLSWQFRKDLAQCDSSLTVVKKSIFLKALKKIGLTTTEEALEGNIGFITSEEDPLPMTKVVSKFISDYEGKLEVLFGRVEGQKITGKDVQVLAKLPPLNEMRAIFLGLLTAPMSGVLSVMESVLTSLVYAIENKSTK